MSSGDLKNSWIQRCSSPGFLFFVGERADARMDDRVDRVVELLEGKFNVRVCDCLRKDNKSIKPLLLPVMSMGFDPFFKTVVLLKNFSRSKIDPVPLFRESRLLCCVIVFCESTTSFYRYTMDRVISLALAEPQVGNKLVYSDSIITASNSLQAKYMNRWAALDMGDSCIAKPERVVSTASELAESLMTGNMDVPLQHLDESLRMVAHNCGKFVKTAAQYAQLINDVSLAMQTRRVEPLLKHRQESLSISWEQPKPPSETNLPMALRMMPGAMMQIFGAGCEQITLLNVVCLKHIHRYIAKMQDANPKLFDDMVTFRNAVDPFLVPDECAHEACMHVRK